MQADPDYTAAITNNDLVRLWYTVIQRAVFYYYDDKSDMIRQTKYDLQHEEKYRMAPKEQFIEFANRWTAALDHIMLADPQVDQVEIVNMFVRIVPDLPMLQQVRREITDSRTYSMPHTKLARKKLSLCIAEFIRGIQVHNRLVPVLSSPPPGPTETTPSHDIATIMTLTEKNTRLEAELLASKNKNGRGGGGGGGGAGRGGGGRGDSRNKNICSKWKNDNACSFGDACKYKHGSGDDRWNGEVMKPVFLKKVNESIAQTRLKRLNGKIDELNAKRVNLLTQNDASA